LEKRYRILAAGVLLMTCAVVLGPSRAGGVAQDDVAIMVDDTAMAVRGRIVDGRTMVPAAAFAGELGGELRSKLGGELGMDVKENIDGGKVEIGRGDRTISFDLGKSTALCGDHQVWVAPGAMVIDGVAYVPLRFLGENLGFRVGWDGGARKVTLSSVLENQVKIATVKDIEETEDLTLNMQYPEIKGLENKDAEAEFNDYFRKVALRCRESGLKNARDFAEWKSESDPRQVKMEEYLDYRIAYNRNDIISVVLTQYEYTGGAHGMTYQTSYTMDLKTGKVYSLSDLFGAGADYVAAISGHVKKGFADKEPDLPLLTPFEAIGIQQDFYIKDESVVIYFQLYEYTPYAAGIQEFPVAFASLQSILAPRFEALIP